MSDYPYRFRAKVQRRGDDRMTFAVVYLPAKLAKQLPLKENPRLRIEAEINGFRHNAAFQPAKGKWYLMMSKKTRKLCGADVGDTATVEFDIADQDAVEIPNELLFALEADDAAAKTWDRITAGKRRSLAYLVSNAKRVETRERRVDQVLSILAEMP